MKFRSFAVTGVLVVCGFALSQEGFVVRDHYTKREALVPMRDGVRLFTAIYEPKDKSKSYPVMVLRTPYSVAPYGSNAFRTPLGPTPKFSQDGFIFVYQDVRGRYMSEGEFVNMRPQLVAGHAAKAIDESTDAYDTIEWVVGNVSNNNGRVGVWGISYPGFYAAAAAINSHPALKAVSPQAPIADWFIGDDFHHNGAFFLIDAFNFLNGFGRPRPVPTTSYPPGIRHGTQDGYKFFLELGPLANVDKKYFKGNVAFWNEMMRHPNYDEFWKSRNLLPHLKGVKTAVMTVGGWFDAEDLYGPLKIYESIEQKNPGTYNILVMGPWFHGGWARSDGSRFGDIDFGAPVSTWYQDNVEYPFFQHFLKDGEKPDLPEALIFCTGSNEWLRFDAWPPKQLGQRRLYFRESGRVSFQPPTKPGSDKYYSDPAKPVPYRPDVSIGRNREYMIWDQRFAATRPDVLVYRSDPLSEEITLAGPITADLIVSTTGTDADFIVKLIDEFPETAPGFGTSIPNLPMAGYQMLVRGEVMRAKFRDSFETPVPIKPNHPTRVRYSIPDVCHTFKKGHRIMVQIQSSWFPLVDRNPQTFVDIYRAKERDFQPAWHKIYREPNRASALVVGVLRK